MNEIEVDFLLPHPIHSTGKHFQDFGNAAHRGMYFLENFIPRRESARAETEGVHLSILFFNKVFV